MICVRTAVLEHPGIFLFFFLWESIAFHSLQSKSHSWSPWANSKGQSSDKTLPHVLGYCKTVNSTELTECSTSSQASGSDELLLWAVLLLHTAKNSLPRHFHINGVLLSKQSVYPTSTSEYSKCGTNNLKAQWIQQNSRRQSSRKWMKRLRCYTFGLAWKQKWGWPQDEIIVIKGRDEQGKVKRFLLSIKVATFTLVKDIMPVP